MPLDELQGWNKVAVGTDEHNGIGSVKHAVGNHSHGDIDIGFLLFRPLDGVMAIRTLNLFVEILAAHHFEAVAIDKFVGIEESALTTALLGIKR